MSGYVYGVALYRKTISGKLERVGFNILPSDKDDEVRVRYGGKRQTIQFRPHELFPRIKATFETVKEKYFFDIQSDGKKKHAAYMRSLYNRRRTEGLCVKCGKPANGNSAYCDLHKRRPGWAI